MGKRHFVVGKHCGCCLVLPTTAMALAGPSSPSSVSSGSHPGFIVSPMNQSCFLNDPHPHPICLYALFLSSPQLSLTHLLGPKKNRDLARATKPQGSLRTSRTLGGDRLALTLGQHTGSHTAPLLPQVPEWKQEVEGGLFVQGGLPLHHGLIVSPVPAFPPETLALANTEGVRVVTNVKADTTAEASVRGTRMSKIKGRNSSTFPRPWQELYPFLQSDLLRS